MEDRLLLELLEVHYEKARERFSEGKHTHEDLTVIILKHQTNHIAHLDADLRGAIVALDKRVDVIEKKIDDSFVILDKKIDDSFFKLDKKIDTSIINLDKNLRKELHSAIRHQTMVFLSAIAIFTAIVIAITKF